MTTSFNLGASQNSIDWMGYLNKAIDKSIDIGSQIAVGAYNSHNAKRAAERQLEAQKELMALQYEYNKRAMLEGPTYYRQGLTDAGYNPVLPFAGSGSGMSGSMHGVSGASAALENPAFIDGNVINNARMVTANLRNIESQTQMNNAQSALTNEKVTSEQNFQKLQLLDKQEKEIYNAHLPKLLKAQILEKVNAAKASLINATANSISAGASVSNAVTNYKNYKLNDEIQSIIRDREKRYKEFGIEHPYLRNVDETLSRYFSGISGSVSHSTVKK